MTKTLIPQKHLGDLSVPPLTKNGNCLQKEPRLQWHPAGLPWASELPNQGSAPADRPGEEITNTWATDGFGLHTVWVAIMDAPIGRSWKRSWYILHKEFCSDSSAAIRLRYKCFIRYIPPKCVYCCCQVRFKNWLVVQCDMLSFPSGL